MQLNTLMFTIATNGYNHIYRKCISSQKRYAAKNSYNYLLIDRLPWLTSPKASAWLKIPLILQGLKAGYDWVFFIDADCAIRYDAPRFESIEVSDKFLYLARGFSGRVNSGVMLVRNTLETQHFFQNLLEQVDYSKIPESDKTLYENGHIIYYSKRCQFLHILDKRWNNNSDPTLDDYVRHFSGGPKHLQMRQYHKPSYLDKLMAFLIRKSINMRYRFTNKKNLYRQKSDRHLKNNLDYLIGFCQKKYPIFNKTIHW